MNNEKATDSTLREHGELHILTLGTHLGSGKRHAKLIALLCDL